MRGVKIPQFSITPKGYLPNFESECMNLCLRTFVFFWSISFSVYSLAVSIVRYPSIRSNLRDS